MWCWYVLDSHQKLQHGPVWHQTMTNGRYRGRLTTNLVEWHRARKQEPCPSRDHCHWRAYMVNTSSLGLALEKVGADGPWMMLSSSPRVESLVGTMLEHSFPTVCPFTIWIIRCTNMISSTGSIGLNQESQKLKASTIIVIAINVSPSAVSSPCPSWVRLAWHYSIFFWGSKFKEKSSLTSWRAVLRANLKRPELRRCTFLSIVWVQEALVARGFRDMWISI